LLENKQVKVKKLKRIALRLTIKLKKGGSLTRRVELKAVKILINNAGSWKAICKVANDVAMIFTHNR